jgi:hypothetical protein
MVNLKEPLNQVEILRSVDRILQKGMVSGLAKLLRSADVSS